MRRTDDGEVRLAVCETAWGWLGLAAAARGLRGLTYPRPSPDEAWVDLRTAWPDGTEQRTAVLDSTCDQLRRYFAGDRVEFSIPLDLEDKPPFLQRVWAETIRIPYGETRTYAELARLVSAPRAFRAIGLAMARNPIPIIVPCHRVVGSDGSLRGYGGGLDLKARLLEMERAVKR